MYFDCSYSPTYDLCDLRLLTRAITWILSLFIHTLYQFFLCHFPLAHPPSSSPIPPLNSTHVLPPSRLNTHLWRRDRAAPRRGRGRSRRGSCPCVWCSAADTRTPASKTVPDTALATRGARRDSRRLWVGRGLRACVKEWKWRWVLCYYWLCVYIWVFVVVCIPWMLLLPRWYPYLCFFYSLYMNQSMAACASGCTGSPICETMVWHTGTFYEWRLFASASPVLVFMSKSHEGRQETEATCILQLVLLKIVSIYLYFDRCKHIWETLTDLLTSWLLCLFII